MLCETWILTFICCFVCRYLWSVHKFGLKKKSSSRIKSIVEYTGLQSLPAMQTRKRLKTSMYLGVAFWICFNFRLIGNVLSPVPPMGSMTFNWILPNIHTVNWDAALMSLTGWVSLLPLRRACPLLKWQQTVRPFWCLRLIWIVLLRLTFFLLVAFRAAILLSMSDTCRKRIG